MTPVAMMQPRHEPRCEPRPFPWDYSAQPKEHVEACNACGGKLWVTLGGGDRYGFPVSAHCCHTCGLVFLSPRMTSEAYAEFYRGTYRDLIKWYSSKPSSVGEASQRKYAQKLIPFLEPYMVNDRREYLLDIGGAPGVCAEKFCEYFGVAEHDVVDPAPGASISVSFEAYSTEAKCDVILCCQTADHLLDLRGSLEKMHSLLSDDGVLWIDILDLLYMLRRHRKIRAIIKVDHPYYVNEVTFMALLAAVGLEPVRIAYMGPHIGFVCKKGPADPTAIMHRDNPMLANIRKIAAEKANGNRW